MGGVDKRSRPIASLTDRPLPLPARAIPAWPNGYSQQRPRSRQNQPIGGHAARRNVRSLSCSGALQIVNVPPDNERPAAGSRHNYPRSGQKIRLRGSLQRERQRMAGKPPVDGQQFEPLFLSLDEQQCVEQVFMVARGVSSARAACSVVIGRNVTSCSSSAATASLGSKRLLQEPDG